MNRESNERNYVRVEEGETLSHRFSAVDGLWLDVGVLRQFRKNVP
jgi:hypothetical protein